MRLSFHAFAMRTLTMRFVYLLLISGVSSTALGFQTSPTNPLPMAEKATFLSLEQAIALAQQNDEWLQKSRLIEARFESLSEGASALPDPNISIGLLNLPGDGFAFNQEPMTQLKLSASQMLPRGDTRALKQQRHLLSANVQPYLRENRRRNVALQASVLWLQAFEASANYHLVNNAKPLFDKLGDIVAASYASSVGSANQQDIIRAELELLKLNDRLIALESKQQEAVAQLSQFLYQADTSYAFENNTNVNANTIRFPARLQALSLKQTGALETLGSTQAYDVNRLVGAHPLIAASEQRSKASALDIDIAKQDYQAQYTINASYALRDDTPEGQSRADFFSVGVSMSLPLFSTSAQDAQVSAATLQTEAIRTEKLLLMKELMAKLQSAYVQYAGLQERADAYQQQILPKIQQHAQAALQAYTNDTGNFSEVVRAKIDELDTQITMLSIAVKQRVALSKIEYYLAIPEQTQGAQHE